MLTLSSGYEGQSCESCARGYYRDYYTRIGNMGSCLPCDCNGNEQSCHMEQNQLRCICKTGYQGDKCENGGE